MTTPLTRSVLVGPPGRQRSVSPACLGMCRSHSAVLAAWDHGINFFFVSADMHWPHYEQLRRGLRELVRSRPEARDELVLACCTYVAQPEFTVAPFEEVLAELNPINRLDVLVAGGAYGADAPVRLKTLRQRLGEGVGGASLLGVSVHDRAAGVEVVNSDAADVVFVRYNPLHPGARTDFFPLLKAERSARVYSFKSTVGCLTSERLTALGVPADTWHPSEPDYYRFVLSRPEVDGVLCGLSSQQEVEQFVEAYRQGPLEPDEQDHLLAIAGLDLAARKAAGRH